VKTAVCDEFTGMDVALSTEYVSSPIEKKDTELSMSLDVVTLRFSLVGVIVRLRGA
jgi:hypothetical protein